MLSASWGIVTPATETSPLATALFGHAPGGVQILPARWVGLWLRFPGRGALTPGEAAQLYAAARQASTYRGI
jgi:hypothetical protein